MIDIKQWVAEVAGEFKKLYPKADISLNYSTPMELLVATILSAQCTDARVNQVTPALFIKYRSPKDFAASPPGELEEDIRSTGFYQNKARAIRQCAADIAKKHGGKVPGTMEELTQLSGVGRKTANVILAQKFGVPAVVVDTHVVRVSGRLGLTANKNPEKIEQDLMVLLPRKDWIVFSTRMILFGRNVCKARGPMCGECPLYVGCPWEGKAMGTKK
ncbi:MAG: endonuclease III [Nitrospinota bacterium]|nr:endonuclease III [Nitrospinota bacterium]